MIITVKLDKNELKQIEKLISEGTVDNIHDFIKYSIQNQIYIEKEFTDGKITNLGTDNSDGGEKKSFENRRIGIELPSEKVKYISEISSEEIQERTNGPIWALKNKVFPVKFVLRFIQNVLAREDSESISISDFKEKMENKSHEIRKKLENLDDELDLKRGYKFSTGFPKNNEKSYKRFFKNFVIHISSNGAKIRGLPYEFGFIDVKDEKIYLTDKGNVFADLESPIIDGYFINNIIPDKQFSDKELEFLHDHIQHNTRSEKDLYNFMLENIQEGNNSPTLLNERIKPYLEKNYPKENGYSQTTADSIRAGLTSRMAELRLIKIIKKGGRNTYEVNNDIQFKEEG